jgi:hypothetical protein
MRGRLRLVKRLLFRFVLFEDLSCFFQIERDSVDDELVFACVVWNGDDVLDTVAVLAEGLNDEIDVYHAGKFTPVRFQRHLIRAGALMPTAIPCV